MITTLDEIRSALQNCLKAHVPPMQVRKDNPNVFEVAGTKPAMQGRQKVDGFYFASVVPKPKDIRLYFFPIYTHPDSFSLSDDLKKFLKGKSCFHIKKLSDEMTNELVDMVALGAKLYQEDDLI
ncbi:hypothetical protein [Marinoscillum furvescens]|nr:hypothetical protein [Marinoscillum furvescens]